MYHGNNQNQSIQSCNLMLHITYSVKRLLLYIIYLVYSFFKYIYFASTLASRNSELNASSDHEIYFKLFSSNNYLQQWTMIYRGTCAILNSCLTAQVAVLVVSNILTLPSLLTPQFQRRCLGPSINTFPDFHFISLPDFPRYFITNIIYQ